MARTVQWEHISNQSTAASNRTGSEQSYETVPTEYSTHNTRPSIPRHETCLGRVEGQASNYFTAQDVDSARSVSQSYTARSSVDTYASTSEEELADEFDDVPEYDVPQYNHEPVLHDAIPTTARDFADLFPTSKRISIRHDDSTIDGNMNLRIDTQLEGHRGQKQNYTLFHLRMHDLRTREFSLRRYCRESGREVCHSIRKYKAPASERRPVLQRASTALAGLMHKPESRPSTAAGLKRSDSGYESIRNAVKEDDDSRPKTAGYSRGRALMPTNTVKLEYSNYAHIDVKRRGAKGNKKYAFEYWGHDYSWKRMVDRSLDHESVSYYLVRADNEKEPLAHISPLRLTRDQAHAEAAMGGWIPPCYMRITDEEILASTSDISDVVVSTGLMALVDDCIKRRFHSKQNPQLHIPLLGNKMHIDYVGPKRLIDEVFHRNKSGGPPNRHPSALRRTATHA